MDRRTLLSGAGAAMMGGMHPGAGQARSQRAPIGALRTNWSRDPFSLGAYSFIAKGAKKRQTRDLASPVDGRLFFAGEATHPDYNSTVHAAHESGLIAADAVQQTPARSIAIVGAGMSGLTAASRLSTAGLDVTVFEARSRIGGRVWTDTTLGVPLDLGASWIHGVTGNPLMQIARDLKVDTRATGDDYVLRGGDGRRMAYREAPDWLADVVEMQHTAGASSAEVNTRAYWFSSDYGGDDHVFPNGYAQVFEALNSDAKIVLNTDIRSVSLQHGHIAVSTATQDMGRFDAVIVTVPLGVLKEDRITFDPPLPDAKRKAIEDLGFGVLDKVYLHYDEVFWDARTTWIITPETGLPQGQFNQWLNLFPYTGTPILVAFNGADPARDLAELSDEEVTQRAVAVISQAYPSV